MLLLVATQPLSSAEDADDRDDEDYYIREDYDTYWNDKRVEERREVHPTAEKKKETWEIKHTVTQFCFDRLI